MTKNHRKEDIERLLSGESQYKEIWVELEDGQVIMALINRDWGWLMYLRNAEGDAGFSTINPDCQNPQKKIEYILDNGQHDEYPAAWAYPIDTVRAALHEFVETHRIPVCVCWQDNALGIG
ncbi:MAG: hypothetical protein F6J87_01475 [Spirulina sp. SIO3F2]|nr:hypothetical protein [Spirulina sp. SIO3F2]